MSTVKVSSDSTSSEEDDSLIDKFEKSHSSLKRKTFLTRSRKAKESPEVIKNPNIIVDERFGVGDEDNYDDDFNEELERLRKEAELEVTSGVEEENLFDVDKFSVGNSKAPKKTLRTCTVRINSQKKSEECHSNEIPASVAKRAAAVVKSCPPLVIKKEGGSNVEQTAKQEVTAKSTGSEVPPRTYLSSRKRTSTSSAAKARGEHSQKTLPLKTYAAQYRKLSKPLLVNNGRPKEKDDAPSAESSVTTTPPPDRPPPTATSSSQTATPVSAAAEHNQKVLNVPNVISAMMEDSQLILLDDALCHLAWSLDAKYPRAAIYTTREEDRVPVPWLYLPIPNLGETWILHHVSDRLNYSTFTYIPEINCALPSKALRAKFKEAYLSKVMVKLQMLWIGNNEEAKQREGFIYILPEIPGVLICGPFPNDLVRRNDDVGRYHSAYNAAKLVDYMPDSLMKLVFNEVECTWNSEYPTDDSQSSKPESKPQPVIPKESQSQTQTLQNPPPPPRVKAERKSAHRLIRGSYNSQLQPKPAFVAQSQPRVNQPRIRPMASTLVKLGPRAPRVSDPGTATTTPEYNSNYINNVNIARRFTQRLSAM